MKINMKHLQAWTSRCWQQKNTPEILRDSSTQNALNIRHWYPVNVHSNNIISSLRNIQIRIFLGTKMFCKHLHTHFQPKHFPKETRFITCVRQNRSLVAAFKGQVFRAMSHPSSHSPLSALLNFIILLLIHNIFNLNLYIIKLGSFRWSAKMSGKDNIKTWHS